MRSQKPYLKHLLLQTQNSINECFPPKKISRRLQKKALNPWVDKDIVKKMKIQNRLFHQFVKTKDPEDRKQYKVLRNKLNKILKRNLQYCCSRFYLRDWY